MPTPNAHAHGPPCLCSLIIDHALPRVPTKSTSCSVTPSLYQKLADQHLCTNTYSTASRRKPVDLGVALSLQDLASNCQDQPDIDKNTSKSSNPVFQHLQDREGPCINREDAASLKVSRTKSKFLESSTENCETIPKVSKSSKEECQSGPARLCQTFDYTSPPRQEDNQTSDVSQLPAGQLLLQSSSPSPPTVWGSSLALPSPLSYSPLVVHPSSCSSSPSTPPSPSPAACD